MGEYFSCITSGLHRFIYFILFFIFYLFFSLFASLYLFHFCISLLISFSYSYTDLFMHPFINLTGARCSSMVACLLIVRCIIGLILHGGPLSYFSFQPILHDWIKKGYGMCHPVYGMVHIKDPWLLIKKSS